VSFSCQRLLALLWDYHIYETSLHAFQVAIGTLAIALTASLSFRLFLRTCCDRRGSSRTAPFGLLARQPARIIQVKAFYKTPLSERFAQDMMAGMSRSSLDYDQHRVIFVPTDD
jgi:hypothetical protein